MENRRGPRAVVRWTLGPERKVRLPGAEGFSMRLSSDARKCVVFLGYPDHTSGDNGITCEGTGFLLRYDGGCYLVTARHVAHLLGKTGSVARINTLDGGSKNVDGDIVRWFFHPDPSVDVAVTPFTIPPQWGFDFRYISESLLLTAEQMNTDNLDVGDLCYTVGLFRVLVGKQRNLPVVHTGNLARLAGEEKIPLKDEYSPAGVQMVDGYLVEAQTLSGLSGAPVFLRPTLKMSQPATDEQGQETILHLIASKDQIYLLGLWQAAWEAPAGEVITVDRGKSLTVPVGMGVVVPASKIVEILELEELKRFRQQAKAATDAAVAATPQGVGRSKSETENPTHREDFNRLLGAAVKPPKSSDRT